MGLVETWRARKGKKITAIRISPFCGMCRSANFLHVTPRDGTALRFRATGASVVRWDASGIDPLAGPPKLVLSTCWPFNAKTPGPLRYLLEAELLLQEPGLRAALTSPLGQIDGDPRNDGAVAMQIELIGLDDPQSRAGGCRTHRT